MPNTELEASDARRLTSDAKSVFVVAAIVHSTDGKRVLIARRPDHLHQGGLWEFPGGKVDNGETARDALYRELLEEVDIRIDRDGATLFREVHHQYPDKAVHLQFWRVFSFAGEAKGNEGQQVRWVPLAQLADYSFPEANSAVVTQLLSSP